MALPSAATKAEPRERGGPLLAGLFEGDAAPVYSYHHTAVGTIAQTAVGTIAQTVSAPLLAALSADCGTGETWTVRVVLPEAFAAVRVVLVTVVLAGAAAEPGRASSRRRGCSGAGAVAAEEGVASRIAFILFVM